MKKFLLLLFAMLMALGVVCNAQALSLHDLFDGENISIGNIVFSDWVFLWDDSSSGEEPDFSLVEVVPLPQLSSPGLRFEGNGEFDVTGDGGIYIAFQFRASTLDARPLIEVNWLKLIDFIFEGHGAVSIQESIYGASKLAEKSVYASSYYTYPNRLYDAASFEPQSQILVENMISVYTLGAPESLASLGAFEQRFPQVPEPATLLLLGTGLVGLLGFRRKFRN